MASSPDAAYCDVTLGEMYDSEGGSLHHVTRSLDDSGSSVQTDDGVNYLMRLSLLLVDFPLSVVVTSLVVSLGIYYLTLLLQERS